MHLADRLVPALLVAALYVGCGAPSSSSPGLEAEAPAPVAVYGCEGDPLPSWAEGETKSAILAFLGAAVDPHAAGFIPPEERLATFDMDGTLLVEKPEYRLVEFMTARAVAAAREDAALRDNPVIAALLAGDEEAVRAFPPAEATQALESVNLGLTPAEYVAAARADAMERPHPRYEVAVPGLVYQPMKELIALLSHHGFRVYLSTASEQDFARSFSAEAFGIPNERVIGSVVTHRVETREGRLVVLRDGAIAEPFNVHEGKPIHIQRRLGRAPAVAVGNSDGDLEMLRYARSRSGPSLAMLVHHDDETREYAYDRGAEESLAAADELGIVVANMADDFAAMFPPDASACARALTSP